MLHLTGQTCIVADVSVNKNNKNISRFFNMKKNKLINICGTARSGSTMVDLMVGNDNRAFSLGEVYAWFRPFRSHHFQIICSCNNNNCPWIQLKNLKEDEFYERCFEMLDVDILVDSSKNLPWVIDNNLQAKKNDISVYNVLLYKEPISFFYSFWKRGISIDKARRYEFITYYKRFFESNLPFISLSYDKLVNDPSTTMKRLCQILDIPYNEGKEKFWQKQHHHLFGSRGTRKQVGTTTTEIRKKERYPQKFVELIPTIETDNLKNKDFQNILSKLKAHEMQEANISSSGNDIYKPYWYYLAKLKQKIRQGFPQKWKHNQ